MRIILVLVLTFGLLHSLTLDEAIQLGLSNSPAIKAAEEDLNQAKIGRAHV